MSNVPKSWYNKLSNQISDMNPSVTEDQLSYLKAQLYDIIENHIYPDEVFEYLGTGAYKEAYLTDIPGLVIKFCSNENPTFQEEMLLDKAYERGVDQFFCPTVFRSLPNTIISTYLENEENDVYNEEEDCWESQPATLDYIEIQPYCEHYDRFQAELSIAEKDEALADQLEDYLSNYWIPDMISAYTQEELTALLAFMKDYHMWDIHISNMGYYNHKPVIFDWLSDIEEEEA